MGYFASSTTPSGGRRLRFSALFPLFSTRHGNRIGVTSPLVSCEKSYRVCTGTCSDRLHRLNSLLCAAWKSFVLKYSRFASVSAASRLSLPVLYRSLPHPPLTSTSALKH